MTTDGSEPAPLEPVWAALPAEVSVPPAPRGQPLPAEFVQAFAEMAMALAANGTLNGASTATDCGVRQSGTCGAGMVDPGWRMQHWCAGDGMDPEHTEHQCAGCSTTWTEVTA